MTARPDFRRGAGILFPIRSFYRATGRALQSLPRAVSSHRDMLRFLYPVKAAETFPPGPGCREKRARARRAEGGRVAGRNPVVTVLRGKPCPRAQSRRPFPRSSSSRPLPDIAPVAQVDRLALHGVRTPHAQEVQDRRRDVDVANPCRACGGRRHRDRPRRRWHSSPEVADRNRVRRRNWARRISPTRRGIVRESLDDGRLGAVEVVAQREHGIDVPRVLPDQLVGRRPN